MKLNKKILSLLLAGALIMGLAACSGSDPGAVQELKARRRPASRVRAAVPAMRKR